MFHHARHFRIDPKSREESQLLAREKAAHRQCLRHNRFLTNCPRRRRASDWTQRHAIRKEGKLLLRFDHHHTHTHTRVVMYNEGRLVDCSFASTMIIKRNERMNEADCGERAREREKKPKAGLINYTPIERCEIFP